jgi:hypothetical protein
MKLLRSMTILALVTALGCEGAPNDTEISKQNVILKSHWQLFPGERLPANSFIWNNGFELDMQDDCNLVLYDALDRNGCDIRDRFQWRVLWKTDTNDKAPQDSCYLDLQPEDSNLVLYTDNRRPLWASNTSGSGADRLDMQTDGNLVMYQGSRAVWSSNTWRANPGGPERVCTHPTTGAVSADAFGTIPSQFACSNSPVLFTIDGGSSQSVVGSLTSGSTAPGVIPCRWATFWPQVSNGGHTVCANFPQGASKGQVCNSVTVTGGNTSVVHL